MKRKKLNTTLIEREDLILQDFEDFEVLEAKVDLIVSEILIFEILILAISWEVFLAEDLADDLGKNPPKNEKISKWL